MDSKEDTHRKKNIDCRKAKLYRRGCLAEDKTSSVSDGGNTLFASGTYNLENRNLTKSRSGRESLQVINNQFKAGHQLGVIMKCLGMLPEDRTDC